MELTGAGEKVQKGERGRSLTEQDGHDRGSAEGNDGALAADVLYNMLLGLGYMHVRKHKWFVISISSMRFGSLLGVGCQNGDKNDGVAIFY